MSVVALKDLSSVFPKGHIRKTLRRNDRIKELPFLKVQSEDEVRSTIIQGFKDIELKNFQYLRARKDNSLSPAENQKLDGVGIISLAGCGSLYLQEVATSLSASSSAKLASDSSPLPGISQPIPQGNMPTHNTDPQRSDDDLSDKSRELIERATRMVSSLKVSNTYINFVFIGHPKLFFRIAS